VVTGRAFVNSRGGRDSSAARECRNRCSGPLVLCKIAAGARTEGGDQFLLVNEPESDLTIAAAAASYFPAQKYGS